LSCPLANAIGATVRFRFIIVIWIIALAISALLALSAFHVWQGLLGQEAPLLQRRQVTSAHVVIHVIDLPSPSQAIQDQPVVGPQRVLLSAPGWISIFDAKSVAAPTKDGGVGCVLGHRC